MIKIIIFHVYLIFKMYIIVEEVNKTFSIGCQTLIIGNSKVKGCEN